MSLVWSIIRVLLIWCFFHKKEVDFGSLLQNCSSSQSRLVRNIIGRKWIPLLKKYHVDMPFECPFHLNRDVFKVKQESRVEYRVNQWYCKVCGKTFLTENHFDNHFDLKHLTLLSISEQSICLANYCDIMRCDAENFRVLKKEENQKFITDLEIWTSNKKNSKQNDIKQLVKIKQSKSASALNRKELAYKKLIKTNNGNLKANQKENILSLHQNENNDTRFKKSHPQDVDLDIKSIKHECVPHKLKALKNQCEEILKICLGGLLPHMSVDEFVLLHEEIYHSSCFYLRCDKYWDDNSTTHSNIPFGLIFILIIVLSSGGCLCYYIIWILFDDVNKLKEINIDWHEMDKDGMTLVTNDKNNIPALDRESNDHYIYISYPVKANKKNFNSYYSRTTHL
ncbi:uncharacterized protein LOC134831849 isoform X2 [Culicoides brevitarsis]|uniref:uncharacterized protein LOC134831849 isoform X2 n=1 Tax=Culicoides brevitarsis TaxID=469753 RepID=UPI00307C5810